MSKLRRVTIFDIFNYVFFAVLALIMILPFWTVLTTSVITEQEYYARTFVLWPSQFTLLSYQYIFASDKILQSMWVTIASTLCGTVYSMFLTTTLSYGLTKKDLPGRGFFLTLLIITMYFGGGLIPFYLLVRGLGMINTFWVLFIPSGVNVFYFMIIKAFFNQLPSSLEESAKVDGASELTIFLRIILPLSLPVLATFSLHYGVAYWNQWYNALLFISKEELFPLQLVLRRMIVQNERPMVVDQAFRAQQGRTVYIFDDGVKMATVMVATIPILLAYPFLQRYFVKGMTLGSIKG